MSTEGTVKDRWVRILSHRCSDMHWEWEGDQKLLLHHYRCRCGLEVSFRHIGEMKERGNWGPFWKLIEYQGKPGVVAKALNGFLVPFDERSQFVLPSMERREA